MKATIWMTSTTLLASLMLATSGSVHPFHQAFSPLREAFGGHFEDLNPSPEVLKPSIDDMRPTPGVLKPSIDDMKPSGVLKPSIDDMKPSIDDMKPSIDDMKPSEVLRPSIDDMKPSPEVISLFSMTSQQPPITGSTPAGDNREVSSNADNVTFSPGNLLKKDILINKTSSFDLDTFTFNRNNTKTDDIFSVFADMEMKNPLGDSESTEGPSKNVVETSSRFPPEEKDSKSAPPSANDITKTILHAVKSVESVLSTMSFMKNLYQLKTASVQTPTSSTASPSQTSTSSVSQSTSEPQVNDKEIKEAYASIVDVLLDVPTLENLRTTGLTSRTEREFLDHMTSVLVGAETRSSALTLDPVTVIALLTLAAYLLRAVYQILAVTGRSFDVADGDLNLALSDLPEVLTRVHNWISTSVVDIDRDERVTRDTRENLYVPGDLAAVLKLHRQGHQSCVREFLCRQLQRRNLRSLRLSDMIIGGISTYYGEESVGRYIDAILGDESNHPCTLSSNQRCSQEIIDDAESLRVIFTDASKKILDLSATYQNWL